MALGFVSCECCDMRPQSAALLLAAVLTFASSASAGNPLVQVPADFEATPAHAYGEMTSEQCLQMLQDRSIAYEQATAGPLVETPVSLSGPLHGVTFRHVHARANGSVMDCRLVLALDDFAQVLAEHGIVEAGYVAAYRPDATGSAKPGQRHPSGLAVDIAWFGRRNGQRLVVETDFAGRPGARTCGRSADAPAQITENATMLRKLVCEAGRTRSFHLVLTPNYDHEHHDHVHLEVRRNVRWFLVQ